MALSEVSILQKNQGSFDAASGTATLPGGTTAGSTVLLIARVGANNFQLSIPDGFEQDITPIGLGGTILHAFRRKDCPAGESSWTVNTSTGTAQLVLWFAYELAGVDLTEPLEQWATNGATGVTSLSTGTTPSTTADDILCIAVHSTTTVTTISGQTNGFMDTGLGQGEIQSQTSGLGHGQGTVAVSRLYPGAGGTFECTATLGASVTGMGAMLVYRAVGTLEVPLPNILAV